MNRMAIPKILQTRVFYHVAFWIVFVTVFTLFLGSKYGCWESFKDVTRESFSYVLVVYINILFLIPHYLLQRKYAQYIFFLLCSLVVMVPVHSAVEYYNFYNVEELKGQVRLERLAFFSLINISLVLALTTGLKLGMEWFKQQQRNQELERERLQAELKFLKSQINPHFLFNTLNNLYALSLQKSDKAPEMILKLSEMMRYLLYESNAKMVSLANEIRCMENYIELERIRQDGRTKINLEINCAENGKMIAPLLFIPFLKNSFKHGVNSAIEAGWIHIKLDEKEGALFFEVENSKPIKPIKKGNENGIGLQNVKRRLELIYPYKHELTISDAASYKTNLKILLR